jgi:hypothetical protein
MNNKQLLSLAIVAGVLVALTGLLYLRPESGKGEFQPGTPLIQGLDPAKISSIDIVRGDKKLVIERSEDGFVLPDKDGYPASMEKINSFLIDVLDIRCAEVMTESPDKHGTFGVTEGDEDAVVISFRNSDGARLVGFIRGKSPEDGTGAYVRLANADTVYLTERNVSIDTDPMDYVERTILEVDTDDIRSVRVRLPESDYLLRENEEDEVGLDEVPDGMQQKDDEVKNVYEVLEWLRIGDVRSADEMELDFDATYICELESGLIYTVRTAEEDGTIYAKLSAEGPDVGKVTIGRDEPEESLKEKDALLQAADQAEEFNRRHRPWIYELAGYGTDNLRKPLSKLVEEVDEEEGDTEGDSREEVDNK